MFLFKKKNRFFWFDIEIYFFIIFFLFSIKKKKIKYLNENNYEKKENIIHKMIID